MSSSEQKVSLKSKGHTKGRGHGIFPERTWLCPPITIPGPPKKLHVFNVKGSSGITQVETRLELN